MGWLKDHCINGIVTVAILKASVLIK